MYFKKIILKFYSFLFFQCVIERFFVASGLVLLERERERERGSSYTWCNSYKLTPFLYRRFLRDLTVKKASLNAMVFYLTT